MPSRIELAAKVVPTVGLYSTPPRSSITGASTVQPPPALREKAGHGSDGSPDRAAAGWVGPAASRRMAAPAAEWRGLRESLVISHLVNIATHAGKRCSGGFVSCAKGAG